MIIPNYYSSLKCFKVNLNQSEGFVKKSFYWNPKEFCIAYTDGNKQTKNYEFYIKLNFSFRSSGWWDGAGGQHEVWNLHLPLRRKWRSQDLRRRSHGQVAPDMSLSLRVLPLSDPRGLHSWGIRPVLKQMRTLRNEK